MHVLCRYRNFRTFTSPEGRSPCQYSCLAVDASGEVVVAGTLDSYEIYVWSMQTGRLLEVCLQLYSVIIIIIIMIHSLKEKYSDKLNCTKVNVIVQCRELHGNRDSSRDHAQMGTNCREWDSTYGVVAK